MQQVKFLRKKHIIRTLERDAEGNIIGGTDEHFMGKNPLWGVQMPSISAAKRASRKLQEANGGMGRGSLRVVEEWPNG